MEREPQGIAGALQRVKVREKWAREIACSKLERTFRMRMPAWQDGVADCVQRLVKR